MSAAAPAGRCLLFAGAPLRPTPGLRARLAGGGRVLAADSSARAALALGLTPELVVGDLDSIDDRTLARLRRRGVPMEVYPTDKDATDGELALRRALTWGVREIVVVGGLCGERLDHGLANILLLGRQELQGRRVTLLDNRTELALLRDGEERRWRGGLGEIVSLLPLDGDATGVTTSGLRWALSGARLAAGSTHGVSNETIALEVAVGLGAGRLLVVRTLGPGQRDWPLLIAGDSTSADAPAGF